MISTKKGHVLCVDDEPNILRSLQWLLQKDFSIQTALDGEEGLRLVKQHDFDVVLSDQRMPGMTGAQFLAHVAAISPRSMRLLLTGYSDMPALLSAVNEGEIWQFIAKPWDNKELKRLLHTAVEMAQESTAALLTPAVEASHAADILVVSNDEELIVALASCLEDDMCIQHAVSLIEAVEILGREYIGVMVSEAKIGTTDVTNLLALVKQQHPEIVSVVVADHTNVEQLVQLINRGQLYRFITKPPKKDYLQFLVKSAMTKHQQLAAAPPMRARYRVMAAEHVLAHNLLQDLQRNNRGANAEQNAQTELGTSLQEKRFFDKLSMSVNRLFSPKTPTERNSIAIEER